LVDPAQKRATAGQDDAAVADVRGELGWGCLESPLDRLDNQVDRLCERRPNVG
jgi:hypothetical protein